MSWQSGGSKKRVSWRAWFQSFWSSKAKKPNGFLINIDTAIAWTLEKSEKYFFTKWRPFEKNFGMFFGNSEFFKNNKVKNFNLSMVEAIEKCIKNIHTKFQINQFVRTWDIVHANSKKVVSRKTRLKFWDKFTRAASTVYCSFVPVGPKQMPGHKNGCNS